MEMRNNPPAIFDPRLRALRQARAARRQRAFLVERCVLDATERLNDVNRAFENVLIIGNADFAAHFIDSVSPEKILAAPTVLPVLNPESLEANGHYDLILSVLDLHSVDDVPGTLARIKAALKPDGLFIGALFGGETLSDLRQALYKADSEAFGGVSARVYPFITHLQAAGLLQQAGFTLPVVDIDRVTVSYGDLRRLVSDLRDLGDTNILRARDPRPLGRKYWACLLDHYPRNAAGKFPAKFEIYWLTGWSPHASQQKPLKPGSAKMRLADALKPKN